MRIGLLAAASCAAALSCAPRSAYQPIGYLPDPVSGAMIRDWCAGGSPFRGRGLEPDPGGEDAGCALFNAVLYGAAAVVGAGTDQVRGNVHRIQAEIQVHHPRGEPPRVCLRPAAATDAAAAGAPATATVVQPVTSPAFFLADPWECF